jgi:hypothetical protein
MIHVFDYQFYHDIETVVSEAFDSLLKRTTYFPSSVSYWKF